MGVGSRGLSDSSMWRTVACLCFLLTAAADTRRLDDYVRHFEELNYDRQALSAHHNRVRRSTNDKNLYLEFAAYGRHFQLRLQPDTEVFTRDAIIEIDGKSEPLDTSHIYKGELYGDPNSRVHGSVIEGRFLGNIKHADSGSYWVEPAEKYFSKPKFHSVIYKEEDVEDGKFFENLRKRREATLSSKGGCGNSDPRTSEWMRTVQNSAVPEPAADKLKDFVAAEEDRSFKYTRQAQAAHGGNRAVRQTSNNKRTCTLFLQSDPELWRYYNETFYQKTATFDQVKQQISALFSTHVNEVNGIYNITTFRDPSTSNPRLYGGFNFRVDRVLINTTGPCDDRITTNDSPYCNRAIDASNLLNLNSYRKHDDYCLAFIFTYRDFSGGTLGLAWVADPGISKGGICTKWSRYSDDSPGSGSFVYKSLNTGIVTIVNYGKLVPQKVSIITFAHELGHNFGAPHDNPDTNPECAPLTSQKSTLGNYIMFASATSGDMPNNNKFSKCSVQKIGAVLTSVTLEANGHSNCFQDSQQAFCGNAIREATEQCDCGYQGDCLPTDPSCCRCCVGASDTTMSGTCMLRPTAACDPSAGPCCKNTCNFYSAAEKIVCKPATECQSQSLCLGNSSSCPTPVPKANLTSCNQNTQVCINGECTASICVKFGWTDCEPPLPADGNTDSLCYVSCKDPNALNGTCWSSSRVKEPSFPQAFKNLLSSISSGQPIAVSPGRACNSYQGYCDVFQKCRLVDADGPLARLKNLLFNPSTLATVRNWIEVYWWAVALMVLGLILLMAGFIKLCAVHTPSSNPRQPKARRLSDTLTLRRRRQGAAAGVAAQRPAARPQEPVAGTSAGSGAPPPYTGLAGSRPVPAGKSKVKREKYEMS